MIKKPAYQCRRLKRCGFNPWVEKILWSRKWQPTPVFLPEKFHGQWNLVGRLQSLGSQRVGHKWALTYKHAHTHTHTHTSSICAEPSLLPRLSCYFYLVHRKLTPTPHGPIYLLPQARSSRGAWKKSNWRSKGTWNGRQKRDKAMVLENGWCKTLNRERVEVLRS